MILCGLKIYNGIGTPEVVREYMIEMCNDEYIEDMVLMPGVLSQINLIKENFYDIDDDSDLKRE